MVSERRHEMRTVHWLFVVSVCLFVGGIGFIIAAGRTAGDSPQQIYDPRPAPVGSVKQIMKGIVAPSAAIVFSAVSSTVTMAGTEDKAPQTDADWEAVGDSAVALAEAGNLLMMEGRAVDNGEWMKMSQAMIDAAKIELRAVEAKNAAGIMEAGEPLYVSCDNCHRRYQRG
jgi:hypothetical protein